MVQMSDSFSHFPVSLLPFPRHVSAAFSSLPQTTTARWQHCSFLFRRLAPHDSATSLSRLAGEYIVDMETETK